MCPFKPLHSAKNYFFVPLYCNLKMFFILGLEKTDTNINPLNPKSDQLLISPYNFTSESHIKVTRIEEMITREGTFWLANKFSLSAP